MSQEIVVQSSRRSTRVVTAGIGFGTALAITISWSVNHSVIWAIIHGVFSWFYVIYWCLFGEAPWAK